ncbi:hypothetical protein MNBD_NITROSPINAE02-1086 [hydrothermal vent metagenome]|uniref:Membrane transport protein MMPL domain-containing protein n=1 Tax=hydrothermal vent metagenome TaxID=652676 RepID=A0A3B1CDA1_9ZZZZ
MNNRLTLYSILSAAIVIFTVPFAMRLNIVTDMTSLLPEGKNFQTARTINRFPVMNRIVAMIEFARPVKSDSEDLITIDRFSAEVGAIDGVKSARNGVTPDEKQKLARFFFMRRFYLAPYSPETVDQNLAITRGRMTLPRSGEMRKALAMDPVGLSNSFISRIKYSNGGSIDLFENRFFSKDAKKAFIFIQPEFTQFDIDSGQRVINSIRQKFKNVKSGFTKGARLRLTGGPVIASDSARIMKSDVRLALVITLAGLVILFFVTLRNFRLLLLFIPPVVVGALSGMAFVWLTLGKIHALTLGFGIALVGLSVDYLLHIIVSASFHKNFRVALKEVFPSIALGFASTAMALGALSISSFPIIKELSVLGLAGLAAAFLVSVTLCPEIAYRLDIKPRLPRKLLLPAKSPHVITILFFIAATLFFGFYALKGKYEGDIKRLNAYSPNVKEDLRAIRKVLRREGGDRYFVITSAPSEEEGLQRCERLIENLTKSGLVYQAPCQTLPSKKWQMANIDSFAQLNVGQFKAKLDKFGFNPAAFDPFFQTMADTAEGRIAPVTLETFPPSSLEAAIEGSSYKTGEGWNLLTFVYSKSPEPVTGAVNNSGEGQVFFHIDRVSESLALFIGEELPKLLLACATLILIALYIFFRSIKLALLALLPPAVSLVWLVGALSYFEYHINVVALCCVIFQLGIGLDYAIYVIRGETSGQEPGISHMAVRLSAITTVISFCALLLAKSPAIFIIGLTICLGVLAAMFCSRILIYFPLGLALLVGAAGCHYHRPVTPLPQSQVTDRVEFPAIISVSDGETKNVFNAAIGLDREGFSVNLSKGPGIPYLKIFRNQTTRKTECLKPSRLCHHIGWLLTGAIKKGYYREITDPSYETGKVEMEKGTITYRPAPKEAGAYWKVARMTYKKWKYTLVITRLKSAPIPRLDPSYKQLGN